MIFILIVMSIKCFKGFTIGNDFCSIQHFKILLSILNSPRHYYKNVFNFLHEKLKRSF